ncbi:hypothetical protein MTO96_035829 [Rhipicephalus appendiculatus]
MAFRRVVNVAVSLFVSGFAVYTATQLASFLSWSSSHTAAIQISRILFPAQCPLLAKSVLSSGSHLWSSLEKCLLADQLPVIKAPDPAVVAPGQSHFVVHQRGFSSLVDTCCHPWCLLGCHLHRLHHH